MSIIGFCDIPKIMGDLVDKNYKLIFFVVLGLILIGLGVLYTKTDGFNGGNKIEVLNSATGAQNNNSFVIVEISGAVEKPGVYKLSAESRIDDLLISAGGISADANRQWVDKNVNRAAKLTDGQKLYIYHLDEPTANKNNSIKSDQGVLSAETGGLVNINTASLTELDRLPGIGQVYGQNIIEHRPYSNTEELVSKGVLVKSVFEKIKNQISVN